MEHVALESAKSFDIWELWNVKSSGTVDQDLGFISLGGLLSVWSGYFERANVVAFGLVPFCNDELVS